MDRTELAGFLRSRRERIAPADVGLPAGRRRRTPGLRREEVARLAFISVEYYTRLEQARGPNPSNEVLAGLTRALRLSDVERDHLHELAGAPRPARGPSREVRQTILDLLDRLPRTAGIVFSATYEVLAWNPLAAALLEDFSALSREERSLPRRVFLAHGRGRLYGLVEAEAFARAMANRLRVTAAKYPDDPEVRTLVADLLAGSERFAALWASHDVVAESTFSKTFEHPVVGTVTVDCDVLGISDRDQEVVLYTAAPGSPGEEALRLLSVLGTQRIG
ncbi:helix-turn-helix transcriptional regulator [Amycolatopsis sp. FU40]|uniref:helix-turn-helix transcriptional regulator n=1 Tax=Amycolatopsis sp. FU40 TaxID=2914159 RepID=UPI001F162C7C|nr:helix-turn-helix transcriptional regulator [Amycolatopsis sp. FU40]UKD59313.1 helix-turn-helix transcriptional regulator [Amycolatopsis sp. FU40]